MSDTKLRDLERRWKETGTVEDEAAYLVERVRVGDLTRERLELAVYCGHEPACVALGEPVGGVADLKSWVRGLLQFGGLGSATAAVAALAASRRSGRRETPMAIQAHTAVESWICCPCSDHAQGVSRLWNSILSSSKPFDDVLSLAPACLNVVVLATGRKRRRCVESAWQVVSLAGQSSLVEFSGPSQRTGERPGVRGGSPQGRPYMPGEFRDAILTAVITWAAEQNRPAVPPAADALPGR